MARSLHWELKQTHSPIGFDLEWRPNFIKGTPSNRVACVQLADHSNVIIVQISGMRTLPEMLVEVLQDKRLMKVGVGIAGDVKKLNKDWDVNVENVLDLSTLARECDPYWNEEDRRKAEARKALAAEQAKIGMLAAGPNKAEFMKDPMAAPNSEDLEPTVEQWTGPSIGLARLAARCLSVTLVKNKKTVTSNWERPLTPLQIEYAANDAAVAYDIYQMLNYKKSLNLISFLSPNDA
ncbi:hypothetical protein M408DRAFT_24497 [Serendipita vermifera MAFF 305830]|uniref:3'-5' exonuclease domain-containing protein n=1 Tax=Serendipita vermifera MAFF 305830 TaxID=933852 RepID=A0A0C2WMR9_SERVB|nr:hypothetical protein M408DRAFT_24497 [Serendipita vermifera MAFF 305830]